MKYLKKYRLFESLNQFISISKIIDSMLLPLGFSIHALNILNTTFDLRLNPDITQNKDSILYNIIDIIKGDAVMDELCPVFQSVIPYHHTNDRITFTIITNPKNTIDNYKTISVDINNFYYKLINNIIYTFERSTGGFNFYSETYLPEGPNIQYYPFLKNLTIEYLYYLYKLDDIKNFDINMLYKITSNNIAKSPDSYTIFYELNKHNEKLYKAITQFNQPEDINKSDDLKDMGF